MLFIDDYMKLVDALVMSHKVSGILGSLNDELFLNENEVLDKIIKREYDKQKSVRDAILGILDQETESMMDDGITFDEYEEIWQDVVDEKIDVEQLMDKLGIDEYDFM